MNQEQKKLQQLALKAKQHPRKSKLRRIALTQLIRTFQKYGILYSEEMSRFPELYNQALVQTMSHLCQRIDEWEPTKQDVVTWVKTILEFYLNEGLKHQ